jgi:hypothetical protein
MRCSHGNAQRQRHEKSTHNPEWGFVPFCVLLCPQPQGEGCNRLIYMVGTAGFEPTTSTV